MLDNAGLKELRGQKMVTPAAKREAVAHQGDRCETPPVCGSRM